MTKSEDNFYHDLLKNNKTSSKKFIINPNDQLQFDEIWEKVNINISFLKTRLPEKQLIGLMAKNSSYFVIQYLSIISSGHVAVLLDAQLKPIEHKKNIISNNVNVVITHQDYLSKLKKALEPNSNIQVITQFCDLINETRSSFTYKSFAKHNVPDNLAVVVFTSGSTGNRKGVMLTHKNLISNTNSIIEYLSLTSSDRMNVTLPFTYTYGLSLLHTHLKVGASIYLHCSSSLGTLISEIEDYECTGLAGVPITFQVLINRTSFLKEKFPTLKYVTQAGGKLADKYIHLIATQKPEIKFFVMYGATEATSRLTFLSPDDLIRNIGSIGKAIPGVKIELLDENDKQIKPGDTGEIVASGDNIMAGYLNNHKETLKVLKNGKLYTGDLAVMNKEGFIYIVGRKSRFVKSMGYKVWLDGIEQTLLKVKHVLNVCAFEIYNPLIGETVAAVVEAAQDADKVELKKALFNHCNNELASYEIPYEIKFIKRMPLKSSGKIDMEKLKMIFNLDSSL